MQDLSWQITLYVAEAIRRMDEAFQSGDTEALIDLFARDAPDEIQQAEDWYTSTPPPDAARLLIEELRSSQEPKIIGLQAGSIILTTVLTGGPTIAAIITALTARSVIKKNHSEARKADADALKATTETAVLEMQITKVVAEAEQIRAQTAQTTLDLIAKAVELGQVRDVAARNAAVETLLTLFCRVNPAIAHPALRQTSENELRKSLDYILFLAANVDEVEEG